MNIGRQRAAKMWFAKGSPWVAGYINITDGTQGFISTTENMASMFSNNTYTFSYWMAATVWGNFNTPHEITTAPSVQAADRSAFYSYAQSGADVSFDWRYYQTQGVGGFTVANFLNGGWFLLSFVYNDSGINKVYVNNALVAQKSDNDVITGWAPAYINCGKRAVPDGKAATAKLGPIFYYTCPLSITEISSIYANGPAAKNNNTSSLLLAHCFHSVDGTNTFDDVSGSTGNILGGAIWSQF